MSFQKYIFTKEIKLQIKLQIKYKSFLITYSFCKKKFFDDKKCIFKNFVVNSIIWSLVKVSEAANLLYSLN